MIRKEINTAADGREQAIEWSHWMNDQNLSYGDLIEWQGYFEDMVQRFPELRDEFAENGIV